MSEEEGVLFYAGFEGTADAVAKGNGKARGEGGGPNFSSGKRGQALLSGDKNGWVIYEVEDNLIPEKGSIEFWVCPVDWEGTDDKFHVFFEASGPGWLLVYKYLNPGAGLFLMSEARQTWTIAHQNFSKFKPGEWHHLTVTWEKREICFYLDGEPSVKIKNPQIPQGLSGTFRVGDHPWHIPRNANSLIDELYIYNRPLNEKEVKWAYEHALDRKPGKDVPIELSSLIYFNVLPFPSKQAIVVEVELGERIPVKDFTGKVWLEPAAGTLPAVIKMVGEGKGKAVIKYTELPRGQYKLCVKAEDKKGKEIAFDSFTLISPGPPVWEGNKIGIPTEPPFPYTPVEMKGKDSIVCWNRVYTLGRIGLPSRIQSADKEILSAPVELVVISGGRQVTWKEGPLSKVKESKVELQLKGSAESKLGTLNWSSTAEFDGMLRYDLILEPSPGAEVDKMELRFHLKPEHATLHHLIPYHRWNRLGGYTPKGKGVVFRDKWMAYWWLGDEERGLAGFCESDEAWDRVDREDGFYIERTLKSVDVVWSFIDGKRKLDKPWRFTFGIQATPVKDIAGWRKFRIKPGRKANIQIIWPTPEVIRYFGYPEATNPEQFRKQVEEYHKKGVMVIPYSCLTSISSQAPEWQFYQEEWRSGRMDAVSGDVMAYNKAPFMGTSPASTWIDFIVWKNDKYVREYDLDGLYHDWTGVCPSTNQLAGCGYIRDGKLRPTYPFFATRELYKRIYTMLKVYGKEKGKDTFMMGHMSSQLIIPVLSFCDAYLDGEQFVGKVKGYYLDLLSLDAIRSEFMGHNYGVMPFFLPAQPGINKKVTRELIGLALLHNFELWPIWCVTDEVNKVYNVLDEFGIVDAQFLPYWKNTKVIKGQNEGIKCSAYLRPDGALLCIFNLSKEPRVAALTIEWEKLKIPKEFSVTDALGKEPVRVKGNLLAVEVKPHDFLLLQVRAGRAEEK